MTEAAETEIKFEREARNGVVPVGTYLFDAARRLGIEVEAECGRTGECDSCAMKITEGAELLSDPTFAEYKQLSDERRAAGERLSCQTKIEKAGELTVMTKETEKEKEKEKKDEANAADYRKQFEEMPLEKKIASLVELEAIALGETFSFVLNSPFKIVEKAMDVLAEFGLKLEKNAKDSARPDEHKAKDETDEKETGEKKKKGKNSKKSGGE